MFINEYFRSFIDYIEIVNGTKFQHLKRHFTLALFYFHSVYLQTTNKLIKSLLITENYSFSKIWPAFVMLLDSKILFSHFQYGPNMSCIIINAGDTWRWEQINILLIGISLITNTII